MKNTIKEIVWTIFGILILVGMFASLVYFGIALNRWCDIREKEVKQIYVDERITQCENAGGKYTLMYSEYVHGYWDKCSILEQEIILK